MDASKLIALLGEDIQNMEKYLDALKDDVSLLNEKLLKLSILPLNKSAATAIGPFS